MAKDASKKQPSRKGRAVPHASLDPPQMPELISFIELRPGLFLNVDHIVSLRVLPQEEGNDFAILQLSSGEKLTVTRSEFSAISGEVPRVLSRMPQTAPAEEKKR